MNWWTALITLSLVYFVNGYSKYGRTCKDIGCLNSEVCVLAEDPCTFGQHSNCGSYPTCKKKSQIEGSHAEPAQPPAPKPTPVSPHRDFDSPPNYPAPAPPSNTHSGSPYGSPSSGGGSPYGGFGGNSNPGGSPYGGSPYGGSNNPGGSPYGGSPYGGSNHPGGSPYGGSSNPGGSPYGGSPYGGNSNPGGSSYGGGNSPYGGGNSPYGGGSPYGGSNNPYGRPSSNTGSGGKSPLDGIFNTLNNFANGGGGHGTPGSAGSGQGLSNIFGNLLGNLSKSGTLNNIFNTRPIMENPNYSSYSSNSRSANPQTYPSGNQPGPVQQNRNYGQSNAPRSGANTRMPSYGWNVSFTLILMYLIRQYFCGVIRE